MKASLFAAACIVLIAVVSIPSPSVAAGQFWTQNEAKSHCPDDTVVWILLKSKTYHFAGTKSYGEGDGAYMCEQEAVAQGGRASRSEKHL